MVQTLDPSAGGVARAVITLSHALVRLGHEVEVVTLDDRARPGWRTFNCACMRSALANELPLFETADALVARTRQRDYVICAKSGTVSVSSTSGLASIRWREHSLLHFSPRHARSLVQTVHFPSNISRNGSIGRGRSIACCEMHAPSSSLPRKSAVRRENHSGSTALAKRLCHLEWRLRRLPIRNVFLEKQPALRGKRNLLFLGRLHPKKGCDLLIDAFTRLQTLIGVWFWLGRIRLVGKENFAHEPRKVARLFLLECWRAK